MNKYITKWQAILVWFKMLIPRWRLLFGFCPSCNSDAPAIDDCPICGSYGALNGDKYPPSKLKKSQWLRDLKSAHEIKYQILNAVSENRLRRTGKLK